MDAKTLAGAAADLAAAYRSRVGVEPLVERYPGMTLEDAYEIQLLQIQDRLAHGASVKGHKVGLTSAAMRRQLGVDQPDYGHLLDDMFYLEHSPIPAEAFLAPRAEPEIAFVLKRPLRGPGVTVAEALAAVDFVLPSLEIVDSRIRDWKIGLLDTIADNASSAGVVLGSRPTPVDAVDLRLVGCLLMKNSEVADTGAGGAVLGSPVNALVWLANTVGGRGVVLQAGHVILPSSCTTMVPVGAGDTVTADFGLLGSVTARFV